MERWGKQTNNGKRMKRKREKRGSSEEGRMAEGINMAGTKCICESPSKLASDQCAGANVITLKMGG